jgi:hypothetical protein
MQVYHRPLKGQGLDLASNELVVRYLDRAEDLEFPRP